MPFKMKKLQNKLNNKSKNAFFKQTVFTEIQHVLIIGAFYSEKSKPFQKTSKE